MAAITGVTGSFSFASCTDLVSGGGGANQLLVSRFTANITAAVHDVTPFNPTSSARKHILGLHHMTGTCDGFLDDVAAHDLTNITDRDVPGALVLTCDSGHTYSCDLCLLHDWNVNVDVQGINTFSASFTSAGPIVPANS